MWIPRAVAEPLSALAAKRPVVIITGSRQTGKTSLLRRTFPTHHYVTLDLPLTALEANDAGTSFLDRNPSPLIIDEVQYAPGLFRFLKAKVDEDRARANQYLLAGSQNFPLMDVVRESLAGRVSIVNLHTLSLAELQALKKEPLQQSDIIELCWKGGYPEVHSGELPPRQFYSDYVATYLDRDVRTAIQVKELRTFELFLRLAAFRSGQLLSYAGLAADAGVSPNTIKAWISVLEASGIIHLLPPYFRNFGKRLIKTPKLYFLDTGLLCFLLDLNTPEQLAESTLRGAVFETLVLGQILRARANALDPVNLYFYREQTGAEVDFVIPSGERLHLVECKYTGDPAAAARVLDDIEGRLPPGTIRGRTLVTSQPVEMKLSALNLELRGPVAPV